MSICCLERHRVWLQDFPMTKPLPAKAEVALEYPDKLYIGTFDRDSRFDAHLDGKGLSLVLERVGDADTRKSIHMHLDFELLAEILRDMGRTVTKIPPDDLIHRTSLADAVGMLQKSLARKK
jgi:hypothetical protein